MLDRLLANWPLKALALVLAFGIWVSITGQDRTVRDFTVPLEIEFGSDLTAVEPPPTAVTVRVEGPRTAIRKLDPLELAVRVDLQGAPLGGREVHLSRSHVTGVPRGVDVALFSPDRIALVLVRRARRDLPVEPHLVGRPADGYALYGTVARPRTVTVAGPQPAVDAMRMLRTEVIPLDDHTAPFVAEVGLVPEDPQVRLIDAEDVAVEVLIDASPVEAVFDDLRVELPFAVAAPAKLKPATVRLVLSGPPWLIEQITPAQIAAVAEVAPPGPQRAEQVSVRVDIRLPTERRRLVTVSSIRPTHVSVQVQAETQERS